MIKTIQSRYKECIRGFGRRKGMERRRNGDGKAAGLRALLTGETDED